MVYQERTGFMNNGLQPEGEPVDGRDGTVCVCDPQEEVRVPVGGRHKVVAVAGPGIARFGNQGLKVALSDARYESLVRINDPSVLHVQQPVKMCSCIVRQEEDGFALHPSQDGLQCIGVVSNPIEEVR